jgi:Apea-like HEPN
VLVVEERVPKSPDNLILMGTGYEVSNAFRMLRALRLAKEGDVHIGGGSAMLGRMLTNRRVGSGFADEPGAAMHGSIARWPGAVYSLSASDTSRVKDLHRQLKTVEDMGEAAPYNLSLALRSFNSSYDRIPAQNDMKLVDLITTAESLLGASVEISFRLSFHVAGILAGTDRERVMIFDDMRAFYDTRNKVVHGGTLESKHRTRLNNYPRLRDYIRRLLVAFLHLATTSEHGHHPKSFRRQLDSNLQDGQKRSALRAAMGLATDPDI